MSRAEREVEPGEGREKIEVGVERLVPLSSLDLVVEVSLALRLLLVKLS